MDHGAIDLRADGGLRKGRAVAPLNQGIRIALTDARRAVRPTDRPGRRAGRIHQEGFAAAVRSSFGLEEDVTPHILQHTAAVHMAEARVSTEEISRYPGHSNDAITARFHARSPPEHLRRAAAALDFARARPVQ